MWDYEAFNLEGHQLTLLLCKALKFPFSVSKGKMLSSKDIFMYVAHTHTFLVGRTARMNVCSVKKESCFDQSCNGYTWWKSSRARSRATKSTYVVCIYHFHTGRKKWASVSKDKQTLTAEAWSENQKTQVGKWEDEGRDVGPLLAPWRPKHTFTSWVSSHLMEHKNQKY